MADIKAHIAIFRCPNTGLGLRELAAAEIDRVNVGILSGDVRHADGSAAKLNLSSAMVSQDGAFIYPVIDEIACFLPHIALTGAKEGRIRSDAGLSQELAAFYDQCGWQKSPDGTFRDAELFEDLRAVSREYIHNCHMRVNRHVCHGGTYLLDVASGPIQFDEYLSYSSSYETRICADVSLLALREARLKLKDRAIYVLADITNLPFANNCIDGIVSLHTIYHVDTSLQSTAFNELHRVLRPKGKAVVVHTWGQHCFLMNHIFEVPARITKPLRRALKRVRERRAESIPTEVFHFMPQPPQWFNSQGWEFELKTMVWRSVSVSFLRTYVHSWLLGRYILKFIFALEERFPYWCGRFGQYPMFVLEKQAAPHQSAQLNTGGTLGVLQHTR